MYLVIQKNYTVFGKGQTPREALQNAKTWVDRDSKVHDLTTGDLSTLRSAKDGEFCISHTSVMNDDELDLYTPELIEEIGRLEGAIWTMENSSEEWPELCQDRKAAISKQQSLIDALNKTITE